MPGVSSGGAAGVGCLARLGGEAWGAGVSRVGRCCGHEHPGRYYSITDASSATSSSSQASSCGPLADLLGAVGGECVYLVWLDVFVVL